MKKLLIVILSVIAGVCLAVGFVGCNNNGGQNHVHTYSTEWTMDENDHWHKATCEHKDEISEKAAHTIVDGKCSVCGYDAAEKRAVAKIDVEKVLKAFTDNAYTLSATKNGDTIEIAYSFKDLFVKLNIGDDKAFVDLSGIYVKDEDFLGYISVKGVINLFLHNVMHITLDEVAEYVTPYLPEGWTVDDLVAIFWNGEKFEFDAAKAIALIEGALFNEDITLANVIAAAQDGFTYPEIVEIFKPEIIAMVNGMLPEYMTLETIMPFLVNVTPAKIQAIFDALCAGELNADLINALLPEDWTIDMVIAMVKFKMPELDIDVNKIIETVNSVVKFINSIDFDAIAEKIEQTQIKIINAILKTFFIEEKVDAGVKYTLNYDIIKNVNQYLYDTTLETIINSVLGDGFVDYAANFGTLLLDNKLSELKAMIEGLIGITLEEVLDYIDEYAEEYVPVIENIISGMIDMFGEDDEDYESDDDYEYIFDDDDYDYNLDDDEYDYVDDDTDDDEYDYDDDDEGDYEIIDDEDEDEGDDEESRLLAMIKVLTANARLYLEDEDFMDMTLGDVIVGFVGQQGITVEMMKEKIAEAAKFLKENTVYTAFGAGEELYNKVKNVAETLTENFPVYFVIDDAGELEELSVKAVIDGEQYSAVLAKGDLLGDIFTEEEKAEMTGAKTKYTVADFKGYIYYKADEYYSGTLHTTDITVTVEVVENGEGTYVLSREYKEEYDTGHYETEKHSYFFADADLSDAVITIEDGTVRYTVICYDYTMIDNNGEMYGYSGYYTTIDLIFGEDDTWLREDESFVDRFILPVEEEVA